MRDYSLVIVPDPLIMNCSFCLVSELLFNKQQSEHVCDGIATFGSMIASR